MWKNKKHLKSVFALIIGACFLLMPMGAGADDDKREKSSHEKRLPGYEHKKLKKGQRPGFSDAASHILNFSEELGLDDDQYSKIKAARLDYKKKNIRLTADVKIARLTMSNQLHSGTFDKEKIIAASGELEKLTSQKIRLNTETMVKVFAVLTPDQIKKVKELRLLGSKAQRKRMREGS